MRAKCAVQTGEWGWEGRGQCNRMFGANVHVAGGGSRTFRPWLPCRRAGADSAAASLAETGSISTFSSDIFSLLLTLVCDAHQGGKSGRKGGPPCWRRRVREEEYHGGAALPGRPACSRETGRREPHTALTQSSAGTLDS